MLDFIYTLFIAPLEYWMHKVLVWGYGITENWGLAIIVMSLVVNFVILPIYIKAESWQEEEQRVRLGFASREEMIRRAFKGQERFAMISTMRRQAGYTAFLSMRSSVGFFLQIPFFFAAYHFLSHFDALSGISFMGLADLGRPDEIFHIGPFPVNFMPILMTVINIVSALIYTQNLAKRDKIQLYSMAALFLVLLYDAASGLVLYWTCNNLFSLGKNVVYDLIHRLQKRYPNAMKLKDGQAFISSPHVRLGLCILALWAVGFVFGILSSEQTLFLEPRWRIWARHAEALAYAISIVFSFVLFWRVRIWRYNRVLLGLVIFFALIFLFYYVKGEFIKPKRSYFGITVTTISFLIAMPAAFIALNVKERVFGKGDLASLFIPSAYWIVILLTGYLPIQAFCTAPEMFSSPDVVLARLLPFTAVLGLIFWGVYWLCRMTGTLSGASFWITLIGFILTIFAFLFPMDVGTIEGFQIAQSEKLFSVKNLTLDVCVLVVTGTLFFMLARRKWGVRFIRILTITASIFAIGASCVDLRQCQGRWVADSNSKVTQLPSYNDRFFGFNKNGENVLIVVLDMFTGHHMKAVLATKPELQNRLKGFVWYPDTLAQGAGTVSSIMTLICGEECDAGAFHGQTNMSLPEKANKMYARKIEELAPRYDVSISERTWMEPHLVHRYTDKDALVLRYMGNAYMNRYIESEDLDIETGSSDIFLFGVSLFKAAPWSLKHYAYLNGRWITHVLSNAKNSRLGMHILDLGLLHQLPEISNAKSQKDTYKFLHLELTHRPWIATETCKIADEPAPEDPSEFINQGHLNCEVCSLELLADWFDWMQKEGVYDNTTIILVSDHGERPYGRLNALLLVKKANAKHRPMTVDASRMQLTDVPLIAQNKLGKVDKDRVRYFYWVGRITPNEFEEIDKNLVTGEYFDPKSWDPKSLNIFTKDYERITEGR